MKEAERVEDEIINLYNEQLWVMSGDYDLEVNKQCALIHVEGIIDEYKKLHYGSLSLSQFLPYIEFWQEVKTIIENK